MNGKLYLVATPIGNLEDISSRALRVLAEADIIAAEDTRVSGRLLAHFGVKKPLLSYYQHNALSRREELLDKLREGLNIALISDAGTPCISDPGADIAAAAIAAGIEVIAIPGASALLTALSISGLDSSAFVFEGFLPRAKAARRAKLAALCSEQRTLIFYEAPHRLRATLADIAAACGHARRIAVCRELTKLHEQVLRLSVGEAIDYFSATEPRGEFVLVLAGAEPAAADVDMRALERELVGLIEQGMGRKQAARLLAERYGISIKSVYGLGLKE
ncbi:MAG: 16S rRNA (cytidine(1402)-2'-O)-methyltransferase [Bacillota bacterium]|nr:16S rRNA (cytidine(1402)-2'-O)-methyltransferase [Bacillota bacterium]